MKTLLIAMIALSLSGCSWLSKVQPLKTEDRIVKVVVKEKCSPKQVDKPDFPAAKLKKEDPLETKAATALADIERRKAYEKELEAAAKECQ